MKCLLTSLCIIHLTELLLLIQTTQRGPRFCLQGITIKAYNYFWLMQSLVLANVGLHVSA